MNEEDILKSIKFCEDRVKISNLEIIHHTSDVDFYSKEVEKYKKKLHDLTFNNVIDDLIKD